MTRVNIVVEGQTEETFVRDVLAPHLGKLEVFVCARSVETSRGHRGGLVSYGKAKRDIERWLKQDKEARVSTMFDVYALPQDFPQISLPRPAGETPQQWATRLEQALATEIGDHRLIPYLQVHEFEALLFSDITTMGQQLGATSGAMAALQQVRSGFATPEHINDSPATAPSKRILQLFRGFQKPLDGVLIASKIGLEVIRRECPHFADWLARLERLANSPG